jgi:hypothetical protein
VHIRLDKAGVEGILLFARKSADALRQRQNGSITKIYSARVWVRNLPLFNSPACYTLVAFHRSVAREARGNDACLDLCAFLVRQIACVAHYLGGYRCACMWSALPP